MAIKFLNTVAVDTDVLYVDASSNRVGVGTTSPSDKLHINDGDVFVLNDSMNQYKWQYGSNQPVWSIGGGNYFTIKGGGSRLVTLNSSGNFGIGTTSPAAKLHVSGGAIRIDDSQQLQFGNGSVRINNDASGRMYLRAPLAYYFEGNGGYKMVLNGNSGNLGIGTTSPAAKLDVASGDIRLATNATFFRVRDTAGAQPRVIGMNASNNFYIGPIDSYAGGSMIYGFSGNMQNHRFYAGGNGEKVRINSIGNVGISTTNPQEKLHVYNGKAYVTPIAYAANQSAYALKIGAYNNTNFDMGLQAKSTSGGSPYMSFRTTTADDVLVLRGGNVGIGTTSPQRKFHVDGIARIEANAQALDLVGTDHVFIGFYPDGPGAGRKAYIGFPGSTSDRLTIANEFNDDISFFTNGSEKVTIENSGNVGIGTTSPTSKLDVRKTIGTGDIMANFTATRAPSTYGPTSVKIDCVDYGNALKIKKTTGTLGTTAVAFVTETNSQVGSIIIGATSTSYNTTSDYRLKENISPILNGIDRLKQLKPKRFNFIGDTSVVDGFIAHEAKEVVPESVTGEKDEVLPNGDPLYQGIDQAKLVPLLTAALQEAITKIEVLENRLQTLENK